MRVDPPGSLITQAHRDPRIAVGIIYPTGSIYITNRPGIANVPGNVIHGALSDLSATSQSLYPDEGRSTIGTLSFTAVDIDGDLTDEIRDQLLSNDRGLGRREVRIFTGDTDDFADWQDQRVDTYVVTNAERDGQSYRFSCADRTREQRVQIFEQAKTRLSSALTAGATTVNVLDTSDFELLTHTASFTDAPSSTVGYLLVKKTGEVIRYTGKTATSFTGCTRGVFNTVVQPVTVDATADDKKPEIIEFIYLEMPAPELLYALQTGVILSSSDTLPTRWHMGIAEADVDSDRYESIGVDLYDPSNLANGLILHFSTNRGLKETDGKKFVEEQIHVPMGTYTTVDPNGVLGIKRILSLLPNSAPSEVLDADTIISHGPVKHLLDRVINRAVIRWNNRQGEFTRTDILLNSASIAKHGASRPKVIELLGVHVDRQSTTTINGIFDRWTERYGEPPIEVEVKASRTMNQIETGDAPFLSLARVPDFSAAAALARTVEIQSRRMNWRIGAPDLRCFASTARTRPNAGGGTAPVLPDGYYTGTGTALSSVLTMTGNTVTANGTLTGGSDMRTSVFYHDDDFTIAAGVTVTISDNVQLRIMGTPTVTGKIDGAGNGLIGLTDPNTVSASAINSPTQRSGFIGTSYGGGRVNYLSSRFAGGRPPRSVGEHAAMPRLNIAVESDALAGLPSDLRGAPGAWGGYVADNGTVEALGGDGGNGGAGLLIISRGPLSFGGSGEIDLSGGDGTVGGSATVAGKTIHAGSGGGGAPGALYVMPDGDNVAYPDLTGAFTANQGVSPAPSGTRPPSNFAHVSEMPDPARPYWDAIPVADRWSEHHAIHYVPSGIELGASDDEIVPAPFALTAIADGAGVLLAWSNPPPSKYDVIEVWEATTNDRTGAVLKTTGRINSLTLTNDTEITRYYWVRQPLSDWHPLSSTGGVEATFGGATGPAGGEALGMILNGGFETGDDTGWETSNPGSVESADGARTGTYYVEVPCAAGGPNYITRLYAAPPTGEKIFVQAHGRRKETDQPDADGRLAVRWYDAAGSLLSTTSIDTFDRTVAGWQLVSGEATVGSGVFFAIDVGEANGTTGYWQFDDVGAAYVGSAGADGDDGDDGADGESYWTPTLVNVTRTGKSFEKTGGTNAVWDSSFYSAELYRSCLISFKAADATNFAMIGLNSDPSTDSNFTSIDYAIYLNGAGGVNIRESGTDIGNFITSYSAGDEFAVTYDGRFVRYWYNNVQLREVEAPGLSLGADSSFYHTGATVDDVTFQAGTLVGPEAVDRGVVFKETFEGYANQTDYENAWTRFAGTPSLSFANTGQFGGKALASAGAGTDYRAYYTRRLIPFDPTALYRFRARIRKTTDASSGTDLALLGVVGLAADGQTLVNRNGADSTASQHYVLTGNLSITVADGWVDLVQYVKGTAATGQSYDILGETPLAPRKLHDDVRFMQPMYIFNLAGGASLDADYQLDYFVIDQITESQAAGLVRDPFMALGADHGSGDGWQRAGGSAASTITGEYGNAIRLATSTGVSDKVQYRNSEKFEVSNGESFALHLRLRRLSADTLLKIGLDILDDVETVDTEESITIGDGAGLTSVDYDSVTLMPSTNTWYDIELPLTINATPAGDTMFAQVRLEVSNDNVGAAQIWDIDSYQVTRSARVFGGQLKPGLVPPTGDNYVGKRVLNEAGEWGDALYSGYVDGAAAAESFSMAGVSATRPGTGVYTITDNLGLGTPTNRRINVTVIATAIRGYTMSTLSANSFQVRIWDGTGTAVDDDFQVEVMVD